MQIGKVVRKGQIKNGEILSSPESTKPEFNQKEVGNGSVMREIAKAEVDECISLIARNKRRGVLHEQPL